MTLYEIIVALTDHFAVAFVCKNVVHGYDVALQGQGTKIPLLRS